MESTDLDKRAAEELLLEAKRAAARASVGGALAWQKCPLPPTNKHFLHNTVCSVLITNKLTDKKRQERAQKRKTEQRKISRSAKNNKNYDTAKNNKSESKSKASTNVTYIKNKHSEKQQKHKVQSKTLSKHKEKEMKKIID